MPTSDDLAQLRELYARTTLHQFLAMRCVNAADAFMDALFRNRHADITAAQKRYDEARAELRKAALERDIG
jgi:hypothetical protein